MTNDGDSQEIAKQRGLHNHQSRPARSDALVGKIEQRARTIQHIETRAIHPRTFHIDPSGRVLVAQHNLPMDVRDGDAVPTIPAAPSQFAGVGDWNRSFTGTSSACALTAGAVAARRSLVPPAAQAPPALRARAVATARLVVNQVGPDERRGAGMIDVANFV